MIGYRTEYSQKSIERSVASNKTLLIGLEKFTSKLRRSVTNDALVKGHNNMLCKHMLFTKINFSNTIRAAHKHWLELIK